MSFISSISESFLSGGTWMWVILALQIVSIAIIIERSLFLFRKRKLTQMDFIKPFEAKIRRGELNEVMEMAKKGSQEYPIARAIQAGAITAMNMGGREEVLSKMDEVLLEETSLLERRTGFLAMLANVGTLTGLLGTIVGMIKSFSAISTANPMEKATLLSTGISEAMNTTAYGLIMAIPALIMFSVLSNRTNTILEDMNQAALKVYNWLSYAYEPIPVRNLNRDRAAQPNSEVTM